MLVLVLINLLADIVLLLCVLYPLAKSQRCCHMHWAWRRFMGAVPA